MEKLPAFGVFAPELLAQVSLFSACSDKELERLARHAEIVDFVGGDVLMTEGQSGHEFYVVIDEAATQFCRYDHLFHNGFDGS